MTPTSTDGLEAIRRVAAQKANSTPRRDRFTLTRWEVEALEALARAVPR